MNSMIWDEIRQLAEGSPIDPATVAEVETLPLPLKRYLSYAIDRGRSNVGFARLRHGGTFRMAADQAWLPIEGEEYFHASEPGFLWKGTVRMNAMTWVSARDKYIAGSGGMLIKLRGALTLGDSAGREMDISSLLRYLAEMPWFPTSFRTVEGLTWREVDEHTVEAILTHGKYTVTGRFTIDGSGQITAFASEDRYREDKGKQIRLPWKGAYSDYREVHGMRIPHQAVVSWETPEGDFDYARFAVTSVEFDVPAPY
jgi:hypothetical protein